MASRIVQIYAIGGLHITVDGRPDPAWMVLLFSGELPGTWTTTRGGPKQQLPAIARPGNKQADNL